MSNKVLLPRGQLNPDRAHYRLPRAFLIALLSSTIISAGAGAWIANAAAAANAAPITVSNPNPQPGFAPLVAKVKPAVVQIATVSTLKEDSADTGLPDILYQRE